MSSRGRILGALLDALAEGLRELPRVRLVRLEANRKAAPVDAIEADPVAACVREIMAERSSWAGSAADLLRAGANPSRDDVTVTAPAGPKIPGTGRPAAARADPAG